MKIQITDDFDLDKIINSGQCFRPCKIEDSTYRFITKENILHIRQLDKTSFDVDCDKDTWEKTWNFYFDLDENYEKKRAQIPKTDEFMQNAANLGKGIRILNQDYFEMLISFIISQRKSIPAIRSCIEKICDKYGQKVTTNYGEVSLFPKAKDIVECGCDGLCDCSLGYRLEYVTKACELVNSGEIDLQKAASFSDVDLLSYLMEIKGVGKKVASCVALFAYKRGGIAPVDVWIDRVINNFYGGVSPFPGYKENSGIYQQYAFFSQTNPE